jgi:hypothetical protein
VGIGVKVGVTVGVLVFVSGKVSVEDIVGVFVEIEGEDVNVTVVVGFAPEKNGEGFGITGNTIHRTPMPIPTKPAILRNGIALGRNDFKKMKKLENVSFSVVIRATWRGSVKFFV